MEDDHDINPDLNAPIIFDEMQSFVRRKKPTKKQKSTGINTIRNKVLK